MTRTIQQVFDESTSTGPKPLKMGADQFKPFSAERLFTSDEVAQYLRCTSRTACSFISDGKLKASFIGRQFLVTESNLKAFVEAQEQERSKG